MRISDWSSDVCSSDLLVRLVGVPALALQIGLAMQRLHQTRQREFLRIAEGEVADAGLATTVGVARVEVEVLDRCHAGRGRDDPVGNRSEEHTSELQSLMRNSYAVFCLQKTTIQNKQRQA